MKTKKQIRMNGIKKSITLLLATFLLLGNYAKAQIVYTDINPDLNGTSLQQTVLGTTFAWGLDDIWPYATSPYGAFGTPVMVAPTATSGDHIAILNPGAMIGPTSAWNVDAFFEPGEAVNVTDKYLGFRVGTAGNYRFGWFKVSVTGTTSQTWSIKSYAYQNTPNTAIAAGDMGTGTGNIAVTGIAVSSAGNAATITASHGTLQMSTTVTPNNATNSAVTWSVTPAASATISATGLLTAQKNGAVTVKATAQDGSNVSGTKVINISGQTVGINEVSALASICYPNPVKNEVMLQFGKEENIRNIRICNIAGQEVYKNVNAGKSKLLSINTASFQEGLYILTFENAEGKKGLQKFVKSK